MDKSAIIDELKRLETLKKKTTTTEEEEYYRGKIAGLQRALKLLPLTVAEFASLKGCSRQTVDTQAKNQNLDSIKRNGKTLIPLTNKNKQWKPGDKWGRPKRGDK